MMTTAQLTFLDARYDPQASCVVCGGFIAAGEGLTARYQARTLRFRCSGCVDRFMADPEHYLAMHELACCDANGAESPASEWCD